jgi:hypothetical protein
VRGEEGRKDSVKIASVDLRARERVWERAEVMPPSVGMHAGRKSAPGGDAVTSVPLTGGGA